MLFQNWPVFQLGVEHPRIKLHQNRRNCKNFIGLYQIQNIYIFSLNLKPNVIWYTFLINLPHGNIKLTTSRELTSSWWCINRHLISSYVISCIIWTRKWPADWSGGKNNIINEIWWNCHFILKINVMFMNFNFTNPPSDYFMSLELRTYREDDFLGVFIIWHGSSTFFKAVFDG